MNEVRREGEEADRSALDGKRVVICEDDGLWATLLSRVIRRYGASIVGIARSGNEGVDLTLREQPDVVLMDLQLPGEDGIAAASRLKELSHARVVIVSAYDDEEHRQEAQAAGVVSYLVKPVTAQSLLRATATACAA